MSDQQRAPLWRTFTPGTMPKGAGVRWVWDERLPRGQISFLGGSAGVGKSVLVWGLAFSVAAGRPFLDAETDQGRVLYLDFDSEPEAQGELMHRVRRGLGIAPNAVEDAITYRVPHTIGRSMSTDMLDDLREEIQRGDYALVIVDAWTSAFYTVRSNDTEQVAAMMGALRSLTVPTDHGPGPNVLIVDHAPKPIQNGPSMLERGIIGSTMKLAGARSAFLLARVPPKDVQGRDVMALHALKNNLARVHDPVGVQRDWNNEAGSVVQSVTDLPEAETGAPGMRRAQQVIRESLDPEDWVARKQLVLNIVQRANVQERTALSALARMVQDGIVVLQTDEQDRRRKLYRLAGTFPAREDAL